MRLRIDDFAASHILRIQQRRRARLRHVMDKHDVIRQQRQIALLQIKRHDNQQAAIFILARRHHRHLAAQEHVFQRPLSRHLTKPCDGHAAQRQILGQLLRELPSVACLRDVCPHQALAEYDADLPRRPRRVEQPDRAVFGQGFRDTSVKRIDIISLKLCAAELCLHIQFHLRQRLQRLFPEIGILAGEQHTRRLLPARKQPRFVIRCQTVLRLNNQSHIRIIVYLAQEQGNRHLLALRAIDAAGWLRHAAYAQIDHRFILLLSVDRQLKGNVRAPAAADDGCLKRCAVNRSFSAQRTQADVPFALAAQAGNLYALRLFVLRVGIQDSARNRSLRHHLFTQRQRAIQIPFAPSAGHALQRRAQLSARTHMVGRNGRLVSGEYHRHTRAPWQLFHVAFHSRSRAGKPRLSLRIRHIHAARRIQNDRNIDARARHQHDRLRNKHRRKQKRCKLQQKKQHPLYPLQGSVLSLILIGQTP